MSEPSQKLTIKTLAEEDRPREKLIIKGRQSLSNAELIAILISSGNTKETAVELAQRILMQHKNDLDALGKLTVADLMQFNGIGEAKAVTIVAALELGRRRQLTEAENKVQIKSSKDIFDIFFPLVADLPHEEFWLLHLNKSNKIINRQKLSSGGVTGTIVDVKMILKSALQKLATSLVVCHNHPSGSIKPSDSDISLTKKLRNACESVDVQLLDHVIVGDKSYYSFADEGML